MYFHPDMGADRGIQENQCAFGSFDAVSPALRNRQDFLCGFSQSDLFENSWMQDEGQFSEALGDLAQPA